jgi:hypothetical protein
MPFTNTRLGPEIRRCMAGDDNADKGYHLWSVLTGKPIAWPKTSTVSGIWDQQCPKHGGTNTVETALSYGIPLKDAQLAKKN